MERAGFLRIGCCWVKIWHSKLFLFELFTYVFTPEVQLQFLISWLLQIIQGIAHSSVLKVWPVHVRNAKCSSLRIKHVNWSKRASWIIIFGICIQKLVQLTLQGVQKRCCSAGVHISSECLFLVSWPAVIWDNAVGKPGVLDVNERIVSLLAGCNEKPNLLLRCTLGFVYSDYISNVKRMIEKQQNHRIRDMFSQVLDGLWNGPSWTNTCYSRVQRSELKWN